MAETERICCDCGDGIDNGNDEDDYCSRCYEKLAALYCHDRIRAEDEEPIRCPDTEDMFSKSGCSGENKNV